ncbi:hypothetical protein E8E13_003423 [Curvularia kusanoi]|uniref:Uncharacterized protein n=1 Tax=Curvularia kusanoi TaxID=90978 RepID=A0A9P4W845_CURKU|nr:hypothetical protein E8E13_003423 [Curvularia kusanoi]
MKKGELPFTGAGGEVSRTGYSRHLTRHAQKDEEAGAEGRGILNTRKRLWRDTAGNIVTQKPSVTKPARKLQPPSRPLYQNLMHTFDSNSAPSLPHHSEGYVPITPPGLRASSISSSSSSASSSINTPNLLPGLLSPNSIPMQLPSPATEQWPWPKSPYAELDLDLPTLVPGQAKPQITTHHHFSRGEQWTYPTSPAVELDLFDTSVAKNTPFADLFDPSIEVFKSYSFTSLRDCWGLFDTLRRQVR